MEAIRSYFDARSSAYGQGSWKARGLFPQEVQAIEEITPEMNFAIDLGCGPGLACTALSSRAKNVLGIDMSSGMLSLRKHSFPVVIADGHDLPVADRCADIVLMRMSLHYFDFARLKMELARALSERGRIIVSSIFPYGPEDEDWFNQRNRIKGKPNVQRVYPAETTVASFAPEFIIEAKGQWNSTNTLSESVETNPHGDAEELLKHTSQAPQPVRRLYGISATTTGHLTMCSTWSVLTLRRARAQV